MHFISFLIHSTFILSHKSSNNRMNCMSRAGVQRSAAEERRRLMPADYARNNANAAVRPNTKRKPRQEISACLKWTCFSFNFLVFFLGVTLLALGVYLCIKDPRPIKDWPDVALNPAVVLSIIGFVVCVVSLTGAMGALRDNIFMLKTFAMCVFFCYIVIVVGTFLLFVLFYSDTTDGLSTNSIFLYSIRKYHTNRNLADFVDYIQEQLECCGASSVSQGYRDWAMSVQFNCSTANPYPEKCGVPFSCCKRSVVSEAAGSSNPLLPAMRSLECWRNALTKRPQDLESDIHTRGCLQPLRSVFESHAVHIGAIVAVIILPVCLSVCVSNILAKQIDHQRYLLEREARRNERRRKRDRQERQRFRDPFKTMEDGQMPVFEKIPDNMAPPLPNSPPPTQPPSHIRKKHRAASSSPRGNAQVSAVPNLEGPPRKEKRRTSQPPTATPNTTSGNPAADARTRQWVLQQSDLGKPTKAAS